MEGYVKISVEKYNEMNSEIRSMRDRILEMEDSIASGNSVLFKYHAFGNVSVKIVSKDSIITELGDRVNLLDKDLSKSVEINNEIHAKMQELENLSVWQFIKRRYF